MEFKYNPQEFATKLIQKVSNAPLVCPFCGGTEFTTTETFASIIISNDLGGIQIGNSIPAGMVICQKCGHINFFALGALDLLPKKKEGDDGKQ